MNPAFIFPVDLFYRHSFFTEHKCAVVGKMTESSNVSVDSSELGYGHHGKLYLGFPAYLVKIDTKNGLVGFKKREEYPTRTHFPREDLGQGPGHQLSPYSFLIIM
jgi:hypothetical protein